ncbi:hypothetical protein GCM10023200_09630 [Actinomycetospora chlora]|uniref:Zinc ribbon domain-containing protein n=1 Tax=Actinomycetospora chlora TaxID=663608 RepID=A0ABP9ACV6_9PSEU
MLGARRGPEGQPVVVLVGERAAAADGHQPRVRDLRQDHAETVRRGTIGTVTSPAELPDDAGGDPACWMHRVCPECGRLADEDPPTRCPSCGTQLEAD